MLEKMIDNIKKEAPLLVRGASWDYDSLLVGGEDWSFSIIGSWRISENRLVKCGCDDDCSVDIISSLIGCYLVDAGISEAYSPVDPYLIFSNGLVLEPFSTTSGESWVLKLDAGNDVYVSVPSSVEN